MPYGYIYKISTTESSKVYIGQTTRTIEERYKQHLRNAHSKSKKTIHLYLAMNKYGIDTFNIEKIDEADNQEELDFKEVYWIDYYDSINNGYNMAPGGAGANIFKSKKVKEKHAAKMQSEDVRCRISKTMHELRTVVGFSEEHKIKIQAARQKRKIERAKQGLKFYDDCSHCATRSVPVYCILNTGERYDFESIIQAGKWWYENYKPFGETYSVATYQRKIEASIAGKEIIYQAGHDSRSKHEKNIIIKIIDIKWFYKKEMGGDANEKVH